MALIKFLTDSAADIPADLARELGIQVLPFPIALEDREIRDCVDYTPEEFYRVLLAEKKIPTHAQLTPFMFEECYQQAYDEGYTHLIYTAINAKGSSTYCNALQARESFYDANPKAREKFTITVIDAGTYTMAYGWAVVQGAIWPPTASPPKRSRPLSGTGWPTPASCSSLWTCGSPRSPAGCPPPPPLWGTLWG